MSVNTTINIQDQDGKLLDLSVMILEVKPVLSQPSVIDEISTPTGQGFFTGDILKKNKRTQAELGAANLVGGVRDFVGATSQVVAKVSVNKVYRGDQIVVSRIDLAKLRQGKGGDLVALDVADFILTGREKDAKEMLAAATTAADAMKIYTTVGTVNTGDLISVVPTGTQPTQTAATEAAALTALAGGKRSVTVTTAELAKEGVRLALVRRAIQYLNQLGSAKSAEALYPFSINGLPLNSLRILSDYFNIVSIKDGISTNFISVTSEATMRTIAGLVGYIDGVKVIQTNQIGATDVYKVMSNRVIARDLDAQTQYLGVVKEATTVKMADGTVKAVGPSDMVVQLEQGRTQAPVYFEEIFTILEGTI